MASIVREVGVEAGSAECWDAVRDFAALHQRLAPGFITGVQMVSPREREITFFSGAVAKEYLVGIDDNRRRLAYTVVESPMGSTHHNASVEVHPDGDARCRFVWVTDVLPDELAERTGALMDRGIAVIKETLETAATQT
ncbi:MAG: SRPBCC family protein [Acidimicrobiales bacterium]